MERYSRLEENELPHCIGNMIYRLNNHMKEEKSKKVECIHQDGLVVTLLGENATKQSYERVAKYLNTNNPVVEVKGAVK